MKAINSKNNGSDVIIIRQVYILIAVILVSCMLIVLLLWFHQQKQEQIENEFKVYHLTGLGNCLEIIEEINKVKLWFLERQLEQMQPLESLSVHIVSEQDRIDNFISIVNKNIAQLVEAQRRFAFSKYEKAITDAKRQLDKVHQELDVLIEDQNFDYNNIDKIVTPLFITINQLARLHISDHGQLITSTIKDKGRDMLHILGLIGLLILLSSYLIAQLLKKIHKSLSDKERITKLHQQALTDIIYSIALTIEKRDPYTSGHQNRVAQLSIVIAKNLCLSDEMLKGIKLGAMIHDIGKIHVPAEILNRPGKLSSAEFELIKEHTTIGYDIIKDVEFPWPIAKMVLQHHERLDGNGYPNGLKGNEIILEAQIISVADVVEAIASHRPYRAALGIKDALEVIKKYRGIYFNSDAVDVCVKLFTEGKFEFKV